ncbi:hypothetical protein ABPG75_002347 [Micractinium tetrahymenae]
MNLLPWLGTAVALLVATALWRRTALRLKLERSLRDVRVLRDPTKAAARRDSLEQGGLVALLDVAQPTDAGSPALLPLGEYFASLQPQGSVSWERLLVSVADRFGLTAALPLALFLPNAWRAEVAAGGLLASFPSQAASSLVTTAVSTLDLAAFGQSVHLFHTALQRRRSAAAGNTGGSAAERAAAAQLAPAKGPLDLLLQGGADDCAAQLAAALKAAAAGSDAGPLLLTRGNVPALLSMTAEQLADTARDPAPAPTAISPLLPDLHLGNGGLALAHSAAGAALCSLMAAVANRLVANALADPALAGLSPSGTAAPGAGDAPQAPLFAVRLREGGPCIVTLEGLLAGLEEGGHAVELSLNSNLTSFGVGLCVRSGGGTTHSSGCGTDASGGSGGSGEEWQQVPLAYPLRCAGLWAVDERGKPLDVLTMVPHASLLLRSRGPQLTFDLEWCLNVRGGTFWLPYAFVDRPWATGEGCRCSHPLVPGQGGGGAGTAADRRRLARLVTAATCVLNSAAQSDRLLFGGYGHIGVCVDSVAALQWAMCRRCTLFPLVLGGEAKMRLLSLYQQARSAGWAYSREAADLQAALAALPYDAVQEPRTAADAARRALACLPPASPFAGVAACRRSLQAALVAAEQLCPEAAVAK